MRGRRTRGSILVVLLAWALLLGAVPRHAAAQDQLPVAPDPSECTAEITFEELQAITGTPPAGRPVPSDTTRKSGVFEVPPGEPADEATVAAVTATTRQLFACANGGDFVGLLGIVSDDFLRELSGGAALTEDDRVNFDAVATPMPEEDFLVLYLLRDVRVLPDGRVGALVEADDTTVDPAVEVDFYYFVEQDGVYLIDGAVENLEDDIPPLSLGEIGTPAPVS